MSSVLGFDGGEGAQGDRIHDEVDTEAQERTQGSPQGHTRHHFVHFLSGRTIFEHPYRCKYIHFNFVDKSLCFLFIITNEIVVFFFFLRNQFASTRYEIFTVLAKTPTTSPTSLTLPKITQVTHTFAMSSACQLW